MERAAIATVLLLQQSLGEMTTVPLPKNLQCPPSRIFDSTGLECSDCDSAFEPKGESMCGCPSLSLQTNINCSIKSLWQGNCIDKFCTNECSLLSQDVSLNRKSCVICSSGQITESQQSIYDSSSKKCSCHNPDKGLPTRTHVVTKKLVEIYDSSGFPIRKDCFRCPAGKAVITKDLYEDGQQFFTTAGRDYIADPYSCISCPDPNMYFDTDYSCVCADGFFLTGESSFGEQSCIENMPSISSSYSKVRFRDPIFYGTQPNDFTLESITFSHMYLKAAAECEYFRSSSTNSLQSCQALGNLCVMSSYDQDSSACKELDAISQRRVDSYHNQDEWKKTLPWLFYSDEANYIANDRGINMKISFHAEKGHVNILSFKLAKFAVNGTFVGIEDLTNQLEYCLDPLDRVDRRKRPHWQVFGHTWRHEYECSLGDLFEKEMFLYDLYLVEECSDYSSQAECLYPVPVLNRNIVQDGKFLNINKLLDDDLDDLYVRRFFVFDNQSGRTSSGTEVLRYANKIVLQIPTQSGHPAQLVPPKLIIEYAIATKDSLQGKVHDIKSSLIFKVEYSMTTEGFWNSIQLGFGFIMALAVVIFGVRMNNWQSRQRAAMGASDESSSVYGLHLTLHAFMVACHTFVQLFFTALLVICAYWFIFFKLQNQVFLLLPTEEEFHGVTNEYIFFNVSFRLMFWCQTIYVSYVIVRQCRSDVFFVDWERPRRGKTCGDIPMWRLVIVANEFNRMQAKRTTCVEFSLMFVALFMLGLGQHKNALPQPNFHDSQDGEENVALAFANTALFWIIAWASQWLWRFLFYERFVKEPLSTKFIDLCTVCNISVFIMIENNKGYYIHGKSPYQSADTSPEMLLSNLHREGAGQFLNRGLSETTGGCQTFDFWISPVFVIAVSKLHSHLRPRQNHFFSWPNYNEKGSNTEKNPLARTELTMFLKRFIDQQPFPSREGLRYVVREPWLAERLLGVTPADFRTNAEPKCVLHPDSNRFLSTTFLGIEIDLLLHDIIVYNYANMVFNNAGISIFLTYAMHLARTTIRSWLGRKNIATKSLIDTNFLGG